MNYHAYCAFLVHTEMKLDQTIVIDVDNSQKACALASQLASTSNAVFMCELSSLCTFK